MTKVATQISQLNRFLNDVLAKSCQNGRETFIQVSLFSEHEDKCFGQHWFRSPEELVGQLESLNRRSEEEQACVAFSPALRKEMAGKKKRPHKRS